MSVRRLFIILTLVLTLVSCSAQKKAFVLESDEKVAAYFFTENSLVEVEIPSDILSSLRQDGSQGQDTFTSLFSFSPDSYDSVTDAVYEERLGFYKSLGDVTGSPDPYLAYSRYSRQLKGSDFVETVDALTPGFDEKAFTEALATVDEHYVYNLEQVLGSVSASDSAGFLQLWLDSVLDLERMK